VCIDTCGGDVERSRDDYSAALVPGIAARFDGNVAAFGTRTHVEKLKGLSGSVLPRLGVKAGASASPVWTEVIMPRMYTAAPC
jgi:hypothetical protein